MNNVDYEESGFAAPPTSFREQRACMVCSLVKTFTQFYEQGCDNCPFLQMNENKTRVTECTSPFFEGLIAMLIPKESWVAKWQRIVRHAPGMYAVSVSGDLPENIKSYLTQRNIPFKVQ